MNDNKEQEQSVTSDYIKGIPSIKENNIEAVCIGIEEIAPLCKEAVYVLDFTKKGFHYIANRDLFLNGHSVEEAFAQGYDFFSKVIHEDDMQLWIDIHKAILRRIEKYENFNDVSYFSFDLCYKSRVNRSMVHHRLCSVFINGHLRYGIVVLSSTVVSTSGHLRMHYTNGEFDEFSIGEKEWSKGIKPTLTDLEKNILILVEQGKNGKEAAKILGNSVDYLKRVRSDICEKLGVKTIIQALILAINLRLIDGSVDMFNKKEEKSDEPVIEPKKKRRPMTPDKLKLIQDALDDGKSVNSIAKKEAIDVSECTIRYHIKRGILVRKSEISS